MPTFSRPRSSTFARRTGGVENVLGLNAGLRPVLRGEVERVALDAEYLCGQMKLDAFLRQDAQHARGDFTIGAGCDIGQHLKDLDRRADLLKEAGEFQTNVAAAHDCDAFRHLLQLKNGI